MSHPIRCRGPWRLQRRAAEPDRWLDEMGFFRKHTARDASCLFRILSENIYNTQRYFHKVRLECVEFMASAPHLFEGSLNSPFESYLKEMSDESEWGGILEISAMSHLYRRDFLIFEANKGPQTKICNGYGETIYLYYSPDTKHFDAVYSREYIQSSSFCQSIVYHTLYEGVYKLKELPHAIDKMLHDKLPTNHVEYFMSENVERRKKQKEKSKIFVEETDKDSKDKNNNTVVLKCKHHTQNVARANVLKECLSIFVFNRSVMLENVCMNCLNINSAKDLLDNGITPFPYKVAKALDPDIYRNIEFDVWSEMRRELRYGARYSDGTTLQVGVKCLCKLDGDQSAEYYCHIQEMRPDGGPCVVFIEELGEKRLVDFEQLQLLPQDQIRPWAPPYRFSRPSSQFTSLSQMLQQLGNVTRKQALSKSRNKSRPSEDSRSSKEVHKQASESWNTETESIGGTQYMNEPNLNYATYQHLDFFNFSPVPVEVQTLPLMVDCRPAAAAPLEPTQAPPAPPPQDVHQNQVPAGGEPGAQGAAPPARASTPSGGNNVVTTYAAGMPPGLPQTQYMGAMGCAPYACAKPVLWCAPHSPPPHAPHAPPPPPPPVNPHVYKSVQANGADLPMNDIATLRYYFNLGVECMWAAYGPPHAQHAPQPAHLPAPPRHYSPRDLAQDMQQVSLQERGAGGAEHKHKPADNKPPLGGQGKGNGQRPLLGPRFKRNQDGNQNNHNHNHNHNKSHNNNKGPNNSYSRRNSQPEPRGAPHAYGGADGECVMEQPMLTLPYIPYPPPLYPVSYYPIESDPAMMGMVPTMGYVSYDDGMEYPPLPYYPPPQHYAPPHAQHAPHAPHATHAPHAPHAQHPGEHK